MSIHICHRYQNLDNWPVICNLNIYGFDMGISYARTQKVFFPEGFTFDNIFYIHLCVFIVNEGKEGPNTTIREPSSANQGNAI